MFPASGELYCGWPRYHSVHQSSREKGRHVAIPNTRVSAAGTVKAKAPLKGIKRPRKTQNESNTCGIRQE